MMNETSSRHAESAITFAADMCRAEIQQAAAEYGRPSAVFRPKLFVDGGRYCALYGEDIHNGCAGFGDTPAKAMADFDVQWFKGKAPAPRAASQGST